MIQQLNQEKRTSLLSYCPELESNKDWCLYDYPNTGTTYKKHGVNPDDTHG